MQMYWKVSSKKISHISNFVRIHRNSNENCCSIFLSFYPSGKLSASSVCQRWTATDSRWWQRRTLVAPHLDSAAPNENSSAGCWLDEESSLRAAPSAAANQGQDVITTIYCCITTFCSTYIGIYDTEVLSHIVVIYDAVVLSHHIVKYFTILLSHDIVIYTVILTHDVVRYDTVALS